MLDDNPPRPLDAHELHVLDQISRAIERDDPELLRRLEGTEGTEGTEGIVHPPVRRTGTRLSWRAVAAVMLLEMLYAAVIVTLPDGLAIAVVIGVQLVLVPAGCLLWARRHGEL